MAETTDETEKDEAREAEERRFLSEATNIGPCKVELRVRIPVKTIQEAFEERYGEIIRTVAFPGFRIGHAPRRLVEKKLGDEVRADVKDSLVADSFKDALERQELEPLHLPDVDLESVEFDSEKEVEYSVTVLVRPTVEIPDYAGITVEAATVEVTDLKVQEVIEDLRRQHAVLEPVPEGRMAEGDVAIIDVRAEVDGEKIVDRENVEYHHPADYAVGLRISALKDAILGKGRDDELTLTETLPDTWPDPDQAGKEMTVTVKLHDVKRQVLPELDDELAENLDYDSVEDLREEVRAQVERHAEQEARDLTDRRIVDALIDATRFDLPEDVVKEEIVRRIDHLRARLRMQGVREEELEEKLAQARSAERAEVEREFRAGFLLAEIAKTEKVFVTESEVEDRISRMAAAYGRSSDDMQDYLEQQDMIGSIRSTMREEKVMEILRRKVKIEEKA